MRYWLASLFLVLGLAPDIAAQPRPKSIIHFPFDSLIGIDFSPDGKTIAVLTSDHRDRRGDSHRIIFCDVQSRLDWGSFDAPYAIRAHQFAFDSTGTFLFIRDGQATHEVYVRTCKLRRTNYDNGTVVPISGDRQASIVADRKGFDFVNVMSGESTTNRLDDSGGLIAVSPSGKAVATREGKKVRLHLLANGKWNDPLTMSVDFDINAALFLPGDKRLLVNFKVIDFSSKKIRDHEYGFGTDYRHITIHPGRKLLAAIGDDGKVHIVHTDDFKVLAKFEPDDASVLAFSPDGETLATGGRHPNPAILRQAILFWNVDELLKTNIK